MWAYSWVVLILHLPCHVDLVRECKAINYWRRGGYTFDGLELFVQVYSVYHFDKLWQSCRSLTNQARSQTQREPDAAAATGS